MPEATRPRSNMALLRASNLNASLARITLQTCRSSRVLLASPQRSSPQQVSTVLIHLFPVHLFPVRRKVMNPKRLSPGKGAGNGLQPAAHSVSQSSVHLRYCSSGGCSV